MTFNKNSIVYFNNITTAVNGLFCWPVIAHMLLMQCSALIGVWVLIAAKANDTDLATPVYLLAGREIIGAFILTFLVRANKLISAQVLWFGTLLISVIGVSILGFSPLFSTLFVCAALIGTSGFRSSTFMIAVDSLSVMQNDKNAAVRVSLFMIISPIFFTILSTSFGWIAEVDISLVFLLSAALGLICLCVTYSNPPDIQRLNKDRVANIKLPTAATCMIWLSTFYNFFDTIIYYIILPLYLYDKTNGDLSQFGFLFGLIGLVTMMGSQLRKVVKKQDSNIFNVLTFCIFILPIANITWGLFYNVAPVAILAIAVKQGIAPIWNASYFVALKETSGDKFFRWANYKQLSYNLWSKGLSCAIGGAIFLNYQEYYSTMLITLGSACLLSNVILMMMVKRTR